MNSEAASASPQHEKPAEYRSYLPLPSEGIWYYVANPPIPIHLSTEDLAARILADLTLAECNDATARMYGLSSPAEVVGLRLQDSIIATEPRNIESIREFIDGGFKLTNGESVKRTVDGTPRLAVCSAVGVVRDEHLVGIWGSQIDITETKDLEHQRRRADTMSALNRLAGGVAHDFNNLLTTILTSVDMLEETLETDHVGRQDAQEIRRAARRAAELTRQLLALSQQQVLVQRPVDLNPVVQRAVSNARRASGQRVDVRIMLASSPAIASVDSEELEQVLTNLATFSSESMRDVGTMSLRVGAVALNHGRFAEPDHVAPGEYVTITFEDSGPPFDQDTIAHLFEPFYGIELAGSVSGLALATLHGFVRQSGGSVVLEPVARGRQLIMYFPVATMPPARTAGPAGGVSDRATVLLAEDEPTVRLLMKRVLQRAGYSVLVASDGDEALALARNCAGHIDLLVTDVIMPGMGGGELSRRLRSEQPHIKVLHVSGYTAGALRQHEALEDGAAFLQKPFSPNALAARVQEILAGERVS